MAVHFLTGATGLVGGALLRSLLADGHEVRALVRNVASGPALAAQGAEVVVGDLMRPAAWLHQLEDAEVVWHAGLPRLAPPLRGRGVRRATGEAAAGAAALAAAVGERPVVLASTILVLGDRPGEAVAEDAPARPVAMGRPAAAAEDALRTPGARVVRLGWVYGHTGMIVAMVHGLRTSRFRMVGAGANAMPVVSPGDAAAAMRAAAAAPPGVYGAAEDDVPTQRELVHAICAATGALRPDHLPPRMAALSFGGALVEGLMASVPLGPGRLRDAGWTPAADWRQDLLRLTRPPEASGPA